MYTPKQWRIAFPIVATVAGALAIALGLAWRAGHPVLAGISAGMIAGLAFAIAWTMRRFVPRTAFGLFVFGCGLLGVLLLWSATAIAFAVTLAALMFAVWFVGYDVLFTGRFHRETMSAVLHLGEGNGRPALIVYHSVHRGFQRSLQPKLAAALAARGWRVDLTTASAAAPADIGAYDLLVLGAPAFNWIPARPITAYVKRLQDLAGKNVVLIVSGGGMTGQAMQELRAQVEAAHGRVAEALELWTSRPNVPRFGATEPAEIMQRLGEDLARRLA